MGAISSSLPGAKATSGTPRLRSGLSYRRSLFSAIGAAVVLCSMWTAFGSIVIPIALRHDFLSTYTAARMASKGEYARLHDPVLIQERLKETDPDALPLPVVRPHFYAFLIRPLAMLPHHRAFWVWIGIQVTLLIGCWIWAVKRFGPDSLIWGALSVPCGLGIFHGQDCVFMLAIAIGGYALARRKNPWAAGAIWGLALMKFHLVLFLAPAMIMARKWKMLGGFAGMGVTLVGWCYALGGMEGVRNYVALLRNKDMERLNPTPEMMISVQGFLANLHLDSEVLRIIAGLAALGVAAYVLRARQPLWRWMTLAITASLFAAPHVYGYDAAMMTLPVWLVQFYSRWTPTRIAFAVFATPLPFLAGMAGSPWSIITPACLAVCFATVVWEARSAKPAQLDDFTPEEVPLEEPAL
jgi:Glycosyltransferase family 87